MSQKSPGAHVAPHRHCRVCGVSIAPTKEYCSSECRSADESAQRKMKNYRRMTYLMMIVAMLMVVLFTIVARLR